ncbi:gem-associated protein 6-like [Cephus cinctus]|uniref:Gem-associated protein 6-like n=1 Tax=Cephus cinctus TaxID=211228 RepID=A0AAJ7FNP5_CEPCN|nr:gem-associated protein 6-like [Cephus cinctus]XP_024943484.1 gem-associated protein 6-like [Cephus cinctus]
MSASEENQSSFSHKVFKNDPLLFKSYVNKKVIIITQDKNTHTGIVYTIDPVSESVVLLNPGVDDKMQMKIIIGHAIKDIIESSEPNPSPIPELFLAPSVKLPASVVSAKKEKIKKFLLENRFPVLEDKEILQIEGVLSIEPPYGLEQCICNNEIILARIQSLLSDLME